MIVVSPYLYYLFALGFPHDPIWPPERFTADLLNFFIPTETNVLGTFGFARAITGKFQGDLYENGVYVGIPLIILIEVVPPIRMAHRGGTVPDCDARDCRGRFVRARAAMSRGARYFRCRGRCSRCCR